MSLEHFNSLRDRRCELWVEAEAAIVYLNERANFHSRNGRILGWLTAGFGVLAGGSGIALITQFDVGGEVVLTILGFITASLAAINQGYNPSKIERSIIETRNKIFIVQRDTKNDLWKLRSKASITVDDDFEVEQASDKLDEQLMSVTAVELRHRDVAKLNLERKKYSAMKYIPVERPEDFPDGSVGVESQMAEGQETSGVQRFGRGA